MNTLLTMSPPPSLRWIGGERMIDEYFLCMRFNGQNQICHLLGKDILVLRATIIVRNQNI